VLGSYLWRANSRYLRRHPLQGAVAVLGVALGVAIMVAVDLSNASARQAFMLSQQMINGELTHQIVAGPAGIDEADYVTLRQQTRLRQMAPVVEGLVSVRGYTLTLLGIDVFAESSLRERPVAEGLDADTIPGFLRARGDVFLDAVSAADLGLTVGEPFTLESDGRPYEARLAGLIGDPQQRTLAQLMVVDIAAAQEWLGMLGRLSRIDLRLRGETEVLAIQQALPEGLRLLGAGQRSRSTADMASSFGASLSAMSLLAVLVGVFLVYNSMGFSVVQRRSLIGLMRALGVTRAQVAMLLVGEGMLLAALGVALGLALGLALGQLLVDMVVRTINDHYFVLRLSSVAINVVSLLKGAAAGMLAAVFAMAVPLLEAVSVAPGFAMKRSSLERGTRRVLPWLNGLGLVFMLGCALVLLAPSRDIAWGFSGLFLAMVGAAMWAPQGMQLLLALAGRAARSMGGVGVRLAPRGVAANLSRTGVAVASLAVAVSATIGVELMVGSFRGSVSDWLDTTLNADLYVAPPRLAAARSERRLDESLVRDITALPGIGAFSAGRKVDVETPQGPVRLHVVDIPATGENWFRLLQGDPATALEAFRQGAVMVSDPYAFRHAVGPGDTIRLPTLQGDRSFSIAGVYQDYDAEQGVVAISGNVYRSYWRDTGIAALGLYLQPGQDAGSVASQIRALAAGRQGIQVRSDAEIRSLSLEIFDRTFRITDVLYLLTVGVAFVGIFGALLALQLEQSRDLAVLRALGFTPLQLGALVQGQTGLMGIMSGLLALPLGTGMAWLLIHVVNRRAFGWQIDMHLTLAPYLQALLLAVAAALLAGIYPAWRMARIPPAAAMREE